MKINATGNISEDYKFIKDFTDRNVRIYGLITTLTITSFTVIVGIIGFQWVSRMRREIEIIIGNSISENRTVWENEIRQYEDSLKNSKSVNDQNLLSIMFQMGDLYFQLGNINLQNNKDHQAVINLLISARFFVLSNEESHEQEISIVIDKLNSLDPNRPEMDINQKELISQRISEILSICKKESTKSGLMKFHAMYINL